MAHEHDHMADLLDLDAEVLSEYHREVAEWVTANLTERARVIDVGAGTGTGALTLARQLPDAEVIALDVDEEMLKHIQDKARASGLADRIRTVQADLDQAWPDGLKTADLVWAANSLHHMGDPARAVAHGAGIVPAFSHRPAGRGARGADPHRHGAGSGRGRHAHA
jgi:ubiquinone/menaquinone biosynthesis C-methylase UbiE